MHKDELEKTLKARPDLPLTDEEIKAENDREWWMPCSTTDEVAKLIKSGNEQELKRRCVKWRNDNRKKWEEERKTKMEGKSMGKPKPTDFV